MAPKKRLSDKVKKAWADTKAMAGKLLISKADPNSPEYKAWKAKKMRGGEEAVAPKKKSLRDKAKPGIDWDNPEAVRGYFDHIDSSIAQKHAQVAENERRIRQRGEKVPPIALSTSTNYPSLKVLNERLKQRAKKIKRSK